jgi:hypothetical protein
MNEKGVKKPLARCLILLTLFLMRQISSWSPFCFAARVIGGVAWGLIEGGGGAANIMIVIRHEITHICLETLFLLNLKHTYETYIHSKKFSEDLYRGRNFGLCF